MDLNKMKSLKSTKKVEKANMERTASTNTADSGFWTTIELLMGKEYRDSNWEAGSENLEGDFRALVGARGRRRKRSSRGTGPTQNAASRIVKQMENTLLVPEMELRFVSRTWIMDIFYGRRRFSERFIGFFGD